MKSKIHIKILKQLSVTLFVSGLLLPFANADLEPDILADLAKDIDDPSRMRFIRDEIKSLKVIPVPEPSNLYDFVKNKQKAIELGKALFWDMKVGSDGVQACASCHFNAGADSRAKNQFSPGLTRANKDASPRPDHNFKKGPNFHLRAKDFPLHVKSDPINFNSTVLRNTNDVISSQGVHYSQVEPDPIIPQYEIEPAAYDWIDATSGTFTEMTTGGGARVPLGFELNIYGDTATEVGLSAAGTLHIQGHTISVFQDQFDGSFVRGTYHLAEGIAPNRRFTVTWFESVHEDVIYDDNLAWNPATFQATLYEGSNDIIFRYQDVDMGTPLLSFGASATVGIEFKDGSFETIHSVDEPVIQNSTALRVFALPVTQPPPASQSDPDGFQVSGINTRRVEPRNTPTVINAVFNHRQFWDGRASNIFNGVNPHGESDPHAYVYRTDDFERLVPVSVSIDNASLASQAVGPPTSSLEMSTDGRTWIDIGKEFLGAGAELPRETCKRMAGLRPLAGQIVHPEDSVLGHLSAYPNPGLNVASYESMIKQAFHPVWWWSDESVRINADGSRKVVYQSGENTFSQMEMNFSLFFGLAVQLYEATLVSDDSPVDNYLAGDENALTESQLVGFHIADDEGRCINCHGRGEFTYAAVSRIELLGETRIRRGDLIDEGFNNIGVRPTLNDLGVGGIDPFDRPLSFARRTFIDKENFNLDLEQTLSLQLKSHLGADGAFKIPTLRNVELTAPYFHNGGESTLEDVIDFYFRGGNFRKFQTNPDLADHPHPVKGFNAERTKRSNITGLGILRGELATSGPGVGDPSKGLDDADRANLVAFLKALTDERVRNREAPFDHPQLFVPNGHPGNQNSVADDGNGNATDDMLEIPAVGANGGAVLPTFNDNMRQ